MEDTICSGTVVQKEYESCTAGGYHVHVESICLRNKEKGLSFEVLHLSGPVQDLLLHFSVIYFVHD